MGKLRFFAATVFGKAAEFLLRLLTGRGSNTPGIIALKICPDFLRRIKMPPLTICVTGTNGKTSSSNLITTILRESGKKVINNSKGSNMAPGLVSALLQNCSLCGKTKAEVAVLETDERSSQYIYPYFTPSIILCTNLFRDSIVRNGHSEFIFDKINDYLPDGTTLVLNGDDMISGMLGEGREKIKRVFFSVGKTEQSYTEPRNEVKDITVCPKCSRPLKYEYYHYHHIGKAECVSCGFRMPEAEYFAKEVDFAQSKFIFSDGEKEIELPFAAGSLFNVFNSTAVAAVCRQAGVSMETIAQSIQDVSSKTGRFGKYTVGKTSVSTLLFKDQNPISGSQSLRYLDRIEGKKDVVLMVTDPKIMKGSEDISWLFDTDFSALSSPDINKIYIGGARCADVALRISLAGADSEKINLFRDYEKLGDAVAKEKDAAPSLAIFFSLYSAPLAKRLEEKIKLERKDGDFDE